MGVNFCHKLFCVVVSQIRRDVLSQHGLDFLHAHHIALLLVKHLEAFFGFLLFALLNNPSVANQVLAKRQVNTIALGKLWLTLHQVAVNLTLGQAVEAKVMQNVAEVWN